MDAKAAAQREVTAAGPALVELSHTVHSHPELAFEEERAAAWVADALSGPFTIEAGVCDIPTAFVATAGSGSVHRSRSAPSTTRCPASAMRAGTT